MMFDGLAAGFADPAHQSQNMFRALMMALARPGCLQKITCALMPPAPLTAALAGVALTLIDHETPVWLDSALEAAEEPATYLRFHTGAPITTNPRDAAFALIADPCAALPLEMFATGTDDYPDRSTTFLIAAEDLVTGAGLTLCGPGIQDQSALMITPEPPDLRSALRRNQALFPRGNDFILVGPQSIAALPRSTRLYGA
jgi:alpha-D-ribose 1-methylphosphonate 5-triphosphate synthase subunit PhnH